jgi:hypothetical protein
MIEGFLAHPSPEALHLPASGRVVRLRVAESGAESTAHRRQRLAAVGRAVIEVEDVGPTVLHDGAGEELQHRVLALVARDAEADDVAGCIVEEPVDADGGPSSVEGQGRTMTDVPVPERVRTLGLPAEARSRPLVVGGGGACQPLLTQHPSHRALLHAGADAAVLA